MENTNDTAVEIEYFMLEDGIEPAREFIHVQPPKMRAKLLHNLVLLEEFGSALRMPYTEFLEDGIFQVRAVHGSDITRVLFFFVVGGKAVLTHGFVKKSMKTPQSEIERAKKYREIYLGKMKKGENGK